MRPLHTSQTNQHRGNCPVLTYILSLEDFKKYFIFWGIIHYWKKTLYTCVSLVHCIILKVNCHLLLCYTLIIVFCFSVHILQLDITNKKDIENIVSFIKDTVGSEGMICFYQKSQILITLKTFNLFIKISDSDSRRPSANGRWILKMAD